jgi:UDP-2,3-diacylglucosamine pyrophosphatase LpxH
MPSNAAQTVKSGVLPAQGRTLALSDLHLGRVTTLAHAPEVIRPLVEGFDCVLLLGDIVDHWYTDKNQLKELEERLFAVCRGSGVKKVMYFRGNHDAAHEEGEEFAIIGGVLFLHGHAVYNKLPGDGAHRARIKAFNSQHYGERRIASRQNKTVWKIVDHMYGRIPMAVLNPFAWPWTVVKRIQALVDEVGPDGGVRGVVLGHSHRPGVKKLGEHVTLFNLGGWIRNTRACAFVQDGNHVRMIHIDNRAKQLQFGKTMFERDLQQPMPAQATLVSRMIKRLNGHARKGASQ